MVTRIPTNTLILRAALVLCGVTALATLLMMGWGYVRGNHLQVSSAVISTVMSPDGHVQAIMTRTDAGSSIDFGYLIDLKSVDPDASPIRVANLYAAQKTKTEPGMTLVWHDDKTLELHYYLARIATIVQEDAVIGGQHITTVLEPQISAAPAL